MDLPKTIQKAEDFFLIDRNFKRGVWALLVLFLLLRSYNFNAPVLDRHSWNQISVAATAMNIYKNPSTFFRPDSNAFAGDSVDPTLGQEFPVFMGLIALGYKLIAPDIWVARTIAVLIALLGWVYVLKLLRLQENRFTSLFILFLYTLNSHNWFFDRALNSDTGMVTFMLIAFYYFLRYLEDRSAKNTLILFAATMLAGLFKPYGLQIGVSFLYVLVARKQLKKLLDVRLITIGILVWVVNLAWLLHTEYNLNASVSIGHNLGFNPGELLSLKFYYVMSQRFFDQITTQFLMFFCIFALFSRKIKNDIFMSLLVGNLFYVILITHGNIGHNYYQLPFTPSLITFSGLGFLYWLRLPPKTLSPKLKLALAIFIMVGYVGYSGKKTWNHFRLAMGPKQIGDRIKEMNLPEDTRLISLENSGTRYHETLYYADKKGWVRRSITDGELMKLRGKGAEIVTLHYEQNYFTDPKKMGPIDRHLDPIWVSYDCKDTYSRPCMLGIYRFIKSE
jgi:4-amino-4-deoxy-L-arabinose transferase-like glycosyltransferase